MPEAFPILLEKVPIALFPALPQFLAECRGISDEDLGARTEGGEEKHQARVARAAIVGQYFHDVARIGKPPLLGHA
jgi:hypothetical protein